MNEIPRTPSPDRPRSIVFIAYPEMGLLDLTGAQTVFWAASKAMTKRGLPGYERHTASLDGGRPGCRDIEIERLCRTVDRYADRARRTEHSSGNE